MIEKVPGSGTSKIPVPSPNLTLTTIAIEQSLEFYCKMSDLRFGMQTPIQTPLCNPLSLTATFNRQIDLCLKILEVR